MKFKTFDVISREIIRLEAILDTDDTLSKEQQDKIQEAINALVLTIEHENPNP